MRHLTHQVGSGKMLLNEYRETEERSINIVVYHEFFPRQKKQVKKNHFLEFFFQKELSKEKWIQ